MRVLVTGGAGFIGRWLVKRLIDEKKHVIALDDLSNGRMENISEFKDNHMFEFIKGDIRNEDIVESLHWNDYNIVYHLAAEINVQKSLDNPSETFQRDVVGTFNILEQCRKHKIKFVFMSSCMVYDRCFDEHGITENHSVKPASPYAAAKLSGEYLTLSYYYSYQLPTVVLRPFNIYGPYQKSTGEGGVIAIFIKRTLNNEPLLVYGDGTQTRDFLYVEDCVDFIIKAGESERTLGQIINVGTGEDIHINQLAKLISKDPQLIKHVPHIHPQSEIMKLKCDSSKAHDLLDWKPSYELKTGLERTKDWINNNLNL
ncbi:MAG: dTDP-glucose 4,6-dehydratase [Promethearchaeota archaeon]